MTEKPTELRLGFHQELAEVHQAIVLMFAQVGENVAMATEALLGDDVDLADRVRAAEETVDATQVELEERIERILLLQAPVASELRYVLSMLRIVPELERSSDLTEHIANRAGTGLTAELPPVVRGILQQMGEAAVGLWRQAADAFADRDQEAYRALDAADDEVDDLHRRLTTQLGQGDLTARAATEVTLLGRFYERLGDHAVHVAGRIHPAPRP